MSSTIGDHAKEHRETYMINLFGSIIPIIMFLIYASTQISSLASESEVEALIATHTSQDMHDAASSAVEGVQKQLNNILSFQIAERIEKQIFIVCENPNLRSDLEPSIQQLIRDYNKVSDVPYKRPTCSELGVDS